MLFRTGFFLLLISFAQEMVYAQSGFMLSGKVKDETGRPLADATILDAKNSQGTISDKDGNFALRISSAPTSLRISHVGYKTNTLEITDADQQRGRIEVILKSSPVDISPVEVLGNHLTRAYDKPWIPIIDFAFSEGNLLLLAYEKRKYDVRLVNGDDSTLERTQLSFVPESFFTDCLDQLHILSADSNYRVVLSEGKIIVSNSSSRKDFDAVVLPCVAATNELFYFSEFGLHNQSIIYTQSNRHADKERTLAIVRDSMAEAAAQDEYQRVWGLQRYATSSMSDMFLAADVSGSHAFFNEMSFYEKISMIPTYDPLLKIRDSLYLFNHATAWLKVYDKEGKFNRENSLSYCKDKNWNKQIVIDHSTNDVYLVFASGEYFILKKFDLMTGNFINETQLDYAPFPESIKIRNGIAYYLLQKSDEFIGYNLFMQRLN